MQNIRIPLFAMMIGAFFLIACNNGIEEKGNEAVDKVYAVFSGRKTAPNHELDSLALYLPFGMESDDTDPYNILLKKGDRSYILFINPHETDDSEVVFETTIQSAEHIRLQETFAKDGKFGYIVIQDVDRDLYSLTVGIGGMKITTETDARSLPNEAEIMMKIVSSITLKNNS